MTLNKPSQKIHQDLSFAARDLKRIGVGLIGMAVRLSEAGMDSEALKLLAMSRNLGDVEDLTKAYADEVVDGVVVRASIN
jgi:cystathionine beta-lyase/cystathionine gamma-synthase